MVGQEVLVSNQVNFLTVKRTVTEVYEEDIPFGTEEVVDANYAKGYQAFIDGKEIPVQTVNKAFAGFPLKKGAHEIQLKFHAPGKRAGLLISLIASCGLLFESLAYSILAIRHKKRILHRIRVVTFTDPISGKSRAFIKTNSPRISRADFKMNGGNPSLTGKSD